MSSVTRALRHAAYSLYYVFMTELARLGFTLLTRRRVEGREHVPPYGPLIVASNHMSFIDPSLVATAVHRRIYFVAKSELYRHRLLGFIVSAYGSVRVSRGAAQRDTMETMLSVLDRDRVICMFPEGTRCPGRLGRARPGAALLALRSGAPILPVAIRGSERVNSPRSLFTRPEIVVSIGQPFTLPLLEGPVGRAQLASMTEMIMGRIAAMLPSRYRGQYAHQPQC